MRPRRLAFAVPGDLGTPTGGYRYARRLLAGLRALGHPVTHLALGGSFPRPTPEDTADAAARLGAVPAGTPVLVDGLALGAMDRAVLTPMAAPLVALVHHPLALETGLDAAHSAHLRRNERDNLALAAHVIVPSPHVAELLISDYAVQAERVTVARPGADRAPLPRAHGDRDVKADPPLILSVGVQVPRKGHDVLLRALPRIADRPWQAVIAGAPLDAAHGRMLRRLHAESGLGDRARLGGCVSGEDLLRLYGQASLFALATRYEGHGMVFDEAMIRGLPIVACATGAVPHTVPTGAGRLVPPEDPEAFADALAGLLDDGASRGAMAASSAAAGAALPTWEHTARIVAAVLDGVAAAP